MGFSKLPNKRDKLFVVCESWFDTHDGPFVLSEDRAAFLRLEKWRDAEAIAAQAPKKRKAAEPLPLDAELLAEYEAYKLSNPTSKAGKKAAQSPEEFRQRGPASISFDSIDRRSF